MIFKKINLVVIMFVLLSVSVFAQGTLTNTEDNMIGMPNPASVYCVDNGGTLVIRDEASGQAGYCLFDDGTECEEWAYYKGDCYPGVLTNPTLNVIVSDKKVYSSVEFVKSVSSGAGLGVKSENKFYLVTTKEVSPEIQSAIYDLRVEPSEIFSPVFSSIENLVVNPAIVNSKIVYKLEAGDVNKPIFKEKEVIQPIFDLRVEYPVEFKLVDNRIIVNDEQIIDYKEIVREKEVMPPIELEIQSAITDGKVYDLKVIPSPESAEFKFIYREKEVMMPVYSDFKVENKKLYLLHKELIYDLKINPPEIYSTIYDLRVEEPRIVIKELLLGIEDEKAVYDLRVEEPAKILWLFPTVVDSKYLIDPADGSAELVNSPWYITSEKVGGAVVTEYDVYSHSHN